MSNSAKRQAAHRIEAWKKIRHETVEKIQKAEHVITVRDAETFHYRVESARKVVCDFWGSTGTWMSRAGDGERGCGCESLIAYLNKAEPCLTLPAAPPTAMVTIFADASLKEGAGGWGAWIKSGPEAGVTIYGPLAGTWGCSTQVEVMALSMAVHHAMKRGIVKPGAKVMLQSDSIGALSAVRIATGAKDSHLSGVGASPVTLPKRMAKATRDLAAMKWLKEMARDQKIEFVVRHVKGHKAADGGRQTVNRLVDRLAREGRKVREAQMTAAQEKPCPPSTTLEPSQPSC